MRIPPPTESATQLARQLRTHTQGEVLFGTADRGRYATDASIYQIAPVGVLVPKTVEDVAAAIALASDADIPVIPRGGGTSQCGQTIGNALIVDTSKYLTHIGSMDAEHHTIDVDPGVVLDHLNHHLQGSGWFFPIDPATASRATLGGMTGNNSAGARSIRYGVMVDNVVGIDVILADGNRVRFDRSGGHTAQAGELLEKVHAIHARVANELAQHVPTVPRNVAGYNLHRLAPQSNDFTPLMVGSEGTLGFFTKLSLSLQPRPTYRVLGVCHFASLREAMDATSHIVELAPSAVELMDDMLIELAHENPVFGSSVQRFLVGQPKALLFVEFSGESIEELRKNLTDLESTLRDRGLSETVVRAEDPDFQKETWEVRKAGLNIATSMKGDHKPVAFIEDCAVPLEHLATYTDRLRETFARHGTHGTFYAHASVGCLHVRPILNIKLQHDVTTMRRIAQDVLQIVKEFKGSFSGEHGDGIIRSEFIKPMLGPAITAAFEEIKDTLDPHARFNPGRIVRPPAMDDRALFRYHPEYRDHDTTSHALNWKPWNGLLGAVEMCNNNGACRKHDAGVMCPSYRATSDEIATTRGRANTLRLALTGQMGSEALASDAVYQALDLCVGCKACKRECPTGVDMTRMKSEALYARYRLHGVPLREQLFAHLPRYGRWMSYMPSLANLPTQFPWIRQALERFTGISARRPLPRWHANPFHESPMPANGRPVVLMADTFNRYFEPDIIRAAMRVLAAARRTVMWPNVDRFQRPICCGRTYLSAGLMTDAKLEAQRTVDALRRHVHANTPIVGLEPSCILTLRDEYPDLLDDRDVPKLSKLAMTIEEYLAADADIELPLRGLDRSQAFVHGHCHQKALGGFKQIQSVLERIPNFSVETIQSTCCGMAGSFGYEQEHVDVSMAIGALDLFPTVKTTPETAYIVADGTSCRRQIEDGTGRRAVHAIELLASSLHV